MALKTILYLIITIIFWIKTIKEPYWGICFYALIVYIRPETISYNQLLPLHIAQTTAIITFVSYLLHKGDEKHCPVFNNILIPFAFFVIWAFIGVYFSPISRDGLRWAYALLNILIICFLMTQLLSTEKKIQIFILSNLAGIIFLAIWGIDQYLRGNLRMDFIGGRYWGSNELAATMGSLFPFILYKACGKLTFFKKKYFQKWERFFFLIGCILIILAVIFSHSRGGLLGLVAGIFYIFIKSKKKLSLILLALFILPVLILFKPEDYKDRINSIFNKNNFEILMSDDLVANEELNIDTSVHGRLIFWKIALKIAKDYPILGVGLHNYRLLVIRYSQGLVEKQKDTHSTYLRILSEMGCGGLFLFLTLIFISFKNLYHTKKTLSRIKTPSGELINYCICIEAAIFSFMISGIFSSYPYFEHLYWFFTLAFLFREISKKYLPE